MMMILSIFMIMSLISSTLYLLNYLFFKKTMFSTEKKTPYECGFEPMTPSYLPFSISFFLISLLFLIFDIEISLLIPILLNFNLINKYMIITMIITYMILIIGIIIEWMMKNIEWLK